MYPGAKCVSLVLKTTFAVPYRAIIVQFNLTKRQKRALWCHKNLTIQINPSADQGLIHNLTLILSSYY